MQRPILYVEKKKRMDKMEAKPWDTLISFFSYLGIVSFDIALDWIVKANDQINGWIKLLTSIRRMNEARRSVLLFQRSVPQH